jgi:hypothetical protein
MKRNLIMAAVAGALALAGCTDGEGGPNMPDFEGDFQYSVSGDFTGTTRGEAIAGASRTDQGQEGFFVILDGDTTSHALILYILNRNRPARGTYEFALDEEGLPLPNKWGGIYVVSQSDTRSGVFAAVGGRLTITDSDANQLRGSFEIQGEGLIADAEAEEWLVDGAVSLNGNFRARIVTTPGLNVHLHELMPSALKVSAP